MAAQVITGLERALLGEDRALFGKRLGLIGNPTTVDRSLRHAIDLLHGHPEIELRALFGPEHGLRGDAQDMIAVDSHRDARTGLPVYSLYGHDEASLMPTQESLANLDAVVFDIQDVGARYYTYVWTMAYAMRACARAGVALIVCDRPNPIGGTLVEGGAVEPGFLSFVGMYSVPNRHGLTAGEIARMVKERDALDVELIVIPMRGWRRGMYFEDTGLPWILPSPNMPTRDTALVYPGMCLIEGTELSEARGTTRPFELFGAPFIDSDMLAERLNALRLPGVHFRPHVFTPMFQKHAGKACGGAQIHVTDREAFRPYRTGIAVLWAVHSLWPEQFAWRTRAYEFVADVPAIDLLAGTAALREGIERGMSFEALCTGFAEAEDAFLAERQAWLLYDDAG